MCLLFRISYQGLTNERACGGPMGVIFLKGEPNFKKWPKVTKILIFSKSEGGGYFSASVFHAHPRTKKKKERKETTTSSEI